MLRCPVDTKLFTRHILVGVEAMFNDIYTYNRVSVLEASIQSLSLSSHHKLLAYIHVDCFVNAVFLSKADQCSIDIFCMRILICNIYNSSRRWMFWHRRGSTLSPSPRARSGCTDYTNLLRTGKMFAMTHGYSPSVSGPVYPASLLWFNATLKKSFSAFNYPSLGSEHERGP
jgi:hypothetical protein